MIPRSSANHQQTATVVEPERIAPSSGAADASIDHDARRAKAGDVAVRDELYTVLRPRMRRFVLRYLRWAAWSGAWDIDDVWQESFLVFTEVLAAWPGEGRFIAYFEAVFSRRLVTHVRALDGRRPASIVTVDAEVMRAVGRPDEADWLIADLLAGLSEIDRHILELHVDGGLPLTHVACRLGCPLDEVSRRWRTIRRDARRWLLGVEGEPASVRRDR